MKAHWIKTQDWERTWFCTTSHKIILTKSYSRFEKYPPLTWRVTHYHNEQSTIVKSGLRTLAEAKQVAEQYIERQLT